LSKYLFTVSESSIDTSSRYLLKFNLYISSQYGYRSNLVGFQNDHVGLWNKNFLQHYSSCLIFLRNYFNGLRIYFQMYLLKFVNTSTKLFLPLYIFLNTSSFANYSIFSYHVHIVQLMDSYYRNIIFLFIIV